jgi:phosphoenolpyruvate synthase/pyruvate phosphate dikinase
MSGPYTQPLVYSFGQGRADGTAAMKDILGGKGAGLAEMTMIGIPVPPGFTIASNLCLHYLESHQFPKRLQGCRPRWRTRFSGSRSPAESTSATARTHS